MAVDRAYEGLPVHRGKPPVYTAAGVRPNRVQGWFSLLPILTWLFFNQCFNKQFAFTNNTGNYRKNEDTNIPQGGLGMRHLGKTPDNYSSKSHSDSLRRYGRLNSIPLLSRAEEVKHLSKVPWPALSDSKAILIIFQLQMNSIIYNTCSQGKINLGCEMWLQGLHAEDQSSHTV